MSQDSSIVPVVYKAVPRFPGYRIGDDGSVWTRWIKRFGPPKLGKEWSQMRPFPTVYGYLQVSIFRDRKRFVKRLHTLILETFVGPCPPGKQCAHDNGVRTDCRLSNIAWKTPLENSADKKRHGTILAGERHPLAKLTDLEVNEIRQKAGTCTQAKLGKKYGVLQGTISRIIAKVRRSKT